MRSILRFLPFLFAILLFIPGCPEGVPETTRGSLIVGVTSELRAGVDVLELHVIQRVDGAVILDERRFSDGAKPFTFPLELPFEDLEDSTGVEVVIEAFGNLPQPLLTRTASSTVRAGRTLLLRVDLDTSCAGASAPECPAPLTCTGGVCGPSNVNAAMLEDYRPDWHKGGTDICKSGTGEPTVIVGRGQGDYLTVNDYDVAQVEAGPQGGHHIWVALRMKNLRQSGTITTLTGEVPELGVSINPFTVIFTFDPDEGGYCKLYGLRFQIDGNLGVEQLLGKKLRITATVKDKDGDVGVGERWVTLSSDIL
ncbi:hypothetical protein [Polyangium aurulentum]|uniref:hypothetical protein n=1 Tax=Polyangium aurulentum TaxID=2567896 RepID=UPI0010AEE55A|nr:hypothetical protein [Polyangium aurulentum]UQA59630.1 hypothetical protein E8A73_003745 [Polyangium aurulentum]